MPPNRRRAKEVPVLTSRLCSQISDRFHCTGDAYPQWRSLTTNPPGVDPHHYQWFLGVHLTGFRHHEAALERAGLLRGLGFVPAECYPARRAAKSFAIDFKHARMLCMLL